MGKKHRPLYRNWREKLPDDSTIENMRTGHVDDRYMELKHHLHPVKRYLLAAFLALLFFLTVRIFYIGAAGTLMEISETGFEADVFGNILLTVFFGALAFFELYLILQMLFIGPRFVIRFLRLSGEVEFLHTGFGSMGLNGRKMKWEDIEVHIQHGNKGYTYFILRPVPKSRTIFSELFSSSGAVLFPENSKGWKRLGLIEIYMNPASPLPPGKVFDPYRERDWLRRKAEGFAGRPREIIAGLPLDDFEYNP